jgi:hypothetical protein
MDVPYRDAARETTPEFVEVFKSTNVPLGHGRSRSVWDLLIGWSYHVDRIDAEMDLQGEAAHDAWNVFDYVAALIVRDFTADGLGLLTGEALSEAGRIVTETDEILKSLTVADGQGLLLNFAAEDAGEGWWWKRIPASGPIHEQLLASATGPEDRSAGQ